MADQTGQFRLVGSSRLEPFVKPFRITHQRLKLGFFVRSFLGQRGNRFFLVRRWQEQGGRRAKGGIVVGAPFVDAVEKCRQRVIVAHRQRVVLVVVAAGTFERQAEKSRAEGMHAIGHAFETPLLRDAAAFVGHAMQAAKGRRQFLFACCIWK